MKKILKIGFLRPVILSVISLFLALPLLLQAQAPKKQSALKIGWAVRDFTPKESVSIPGQHYTRMSQGVMDPLLVTALVLENNGKSVLFLTADLLGFGTAQYNRLLKEVGAAAPDLPLQNLILNTTHTHTSIELSPFLPPTKQSRKNWELFRQMCTEALQEAWSNRKPGMIARGQADAYIGTQRRVIFKNIQIPKGEIPSGPFFNGRGVVYGNSDSPEFSHLEAQPSSEVNFLFTFDTTKKLTGVLINIPCPAQCSEGLWKLSADYWADVRKAIHETYGNDVFVYAQCGAAGDLSPHEQVLKRAKIRRYSVKYRRRPAFHNEFERLEIMERVLRAMKETLAWAPNQMMRNPAIDFRSIKATLPALKISKEMYEESKLHLEAIKDLQPKPEWDDAHKKKFSELLKTNRTRYQDNVRKYEEGYKNATEDVEINIALVGGMAFVTCPYELYSNYLQQLQARSPYDQTVIAQLSGSRYGKWSTYLGTRDAFLNRGYGSNPYSSRLDPEAGEILIDKAVQTLKEMRKAKAVKK